MSRLLIRAHLARQAHKTDRNRNPHQTCPKSVSQLVIHAVLGIRGDRLVNSVAVLSNFRVYRDRVLASGQQVNKTKP